MGADGRGDQHLFFVVTARPAATDMQSETDANAGHEGTTSRRETGGGGGGISAATATAAAAAAATAESQDDDFFLFCFWG